MIDKIDFTDLDKRTMAQMNVQAKELIDDLCDYSEIVVNKPWGYEYLIFENDQVAVWILCLKPNAETSMHCHPNKKTSLVVLEGEIICSTLSQKYQRSVGQGLLIEKGVFHQSRAKSATGAFIMEIETPINKRDLIRFKDKYGRVSKGYENADKYSPNIQNYNYLSFGASEAYYNIKKRFGYCSLTFRKYSNSKGLNEVMDLDDNDVISVLRGQILDFNHQSIAGVGDTLSVRDLKSFQGLTTGRYLELLITKKIDRIIKVSDYVAQFLRSNGIREVFIAPGDANVHLLDSIGRDEGLKFICCQTEKSAVMAAESFSKLSGKLGVAVVSSGSSSLYTVPGIANCWVDSAPILILSGQARTDQDFDGRVRQLGNKCLDTLQIVNSITKYAVKVNDATEIREKLERAAFLAKQTRPGPVWVELPIDIQGVTVDFNDLIPFEIPEIVVGNVIEKVLELLKLLRTCKRPVILAGNGIRLAHAENIFHRLIDRLGIPVLTSRRGIDLVPSDHPMFFGRPGAGGQRRANFIIQNCDLLISIGSRLSIPMIGRNTSAFARAAKKVVVDIDPNELAKQTLKVDVGICCSADQFLLTFEANLSDSRLDFSEWVQKCQDWSQKFSPNAEGYKHSELINPYLFMQAISKQLGGEEVVVIDGGSVLSYVMQTFHAKKGQRLITSTGLEYPGFAVSAAIGASVAERRRPIICLCEDRGLHISSPELQTLADNHLQVKIFVLKNKGHSIVRRIQKDFFGSRYIGTDSEIRLGTPAFLELGKVYGINTCALETPNEIDSKVSEVLKSEKTVLCEVLVDNNQELIPRSGFTIKGDGKWIAKPLEDMYPYLDRKTIKGNMLINLIEDI